MKLILVRHPPVEVPPGTCYGSSDVPLAPGWEGWIDGLRGRLGEARGEMGVVSSPLARCRTPAEALGAAVVVDERLREMDFGAWEGKTWQEIPRADLDRWNADLVNTAPPDGETLGSVDARAAAFVGELRRTDLERCVAFTHGGPIRCILARTLTMPLERLFRLRADPGSVSIVDVSSTPPIVELVNLTLGPGDLAPAGRGTAVEPSVSSSGCRTPPRSHR